METYSVVLCILEILSLAMLALFYGYKLWKVIRSHKTKESEPSARTRSAHVHELDIELSLHVKSK